MDDFRSSNIYGAVHVIFIFIVTFTALTILPESLSLLIYFLFIDCSPQLPPSATEFISTAPYAIICNEFIPIYIIHIL
jgi:hypothetical protein